MHVRNLNEFYEHLDVTGINKIMYCNPLLYELIFIEFVLQLICVFFSKIKDFKHEATKTPTLPHPGRSFADLSNNTPTSWDTSLSQNIA